MLVLSAKVRVRHVVKARLLLMALPRALRVIPVNIKIKTRLLHTTTARLVIKVRQRRTAKPHVANAPPAPIKKQLLLR